MGMFVWEFDQKVVILWKSFVKSLFWAWKPDFCGKKPGFLRWLENRILDGVKAEFWLWHGSRFLAWEPIFVVWKPSFGFVAWEPKILWHGSQILWNRSRFLFVWCESQILWHKSRVFLKPSFVLLAWKPDFLFLTWKPGFGLKAGFLVFKNASID